MGEGLETTDAQPWPQTFGLQQTGMDDFLVVRISHCTRTHSWNQKGLGQLGHFHLIEGTVKYTVGQRDGEAQGGVAVLCPPL